MTVTKHGDLLNLFDTVLLSYDHIPLDNEEERKQFIHLAENFRKHRKRIFFVTSDDRSSRREIVEKLISFKIETNTDEIICTTYLLAKYLSRFLNDGKVYTIGSTGMSEELSLAGIQNFGSGEDILEPDLPTYLQLFANEPLHFDGVIVGFDEHLTYSKLIRATTYLNNSKTSFLGTSSRRPTSALISCVECSAERKALIFEDSDHFRKTLYDSCNVTAEKTLYIGNRDESDILLGKRCAFKTLLISSDRIAGGDLAEAETSGSSEKIIPDFHFRTLADLVSASDISSNLNGP